MLIPHEMELTIMQADGEKYVPLHLVGVFVEDAGKQTDSSGTTRNPITWRCQIDLDVYPVEVKPGDYVTAGKVGETMTALECIRAGFHRVESVKVRESPAGGFPYTKVCELT